MPRFDGTLARRLDFDSSIWPEGNPSRHSGRLPSRPRLLRGPDKYKVLERRRHRAQIAARRLLDLID